MFLLLVLILALFVVFCKEDKLKEKQSASLDFYLHLAI